MVQDQLVDYITSQLKAGVSADAIRTALLGAGWQAADVDDTMKKVQGAAPAGTQAAQKPAQPQVIRVSDLVSSSAGQRPVSFSANPADKPAAVAAAAGGTSAAKTDAVMAKIASGAKPAGTAAAASPSTGMMMGTAKKSRALVTESVLGVLMLAFAAAAIFLYFENQGLASQLSSLNGQSSGVSSQVAALQTQFNASTSALQAQMSSTTADNAELMLELSFYAAIPGMTPATTSVSSLSGTVTGGGKYLYAITALHGAKIMVANSKDPRVVALLGPLTATSSVPAQFSGEYVPGSDSMTLVSVNGTMVVPPPAPAAATSTATSSPALKGAAATSTAATASTTAATTTGK